MDQFRSSLRFCNLEFDEGAIADGLMEQSRIFLKILSDFRELSFCGSNNKNQSSFFHPF